MADESRGGRRAGVGIVGGIFLLALGILGAQLYLNPPHARPVVACWVPYQVTRLALVETPKLLRPRDAEIPLDNSLRVSRWNRECICMVSGWTWLTDGKRPNLPFSCGRDP